MIVIEQNKQPVISLKGLTKRFGSKEILKSIDLQVYEGQIIGYIGPNGAGKSTTVKIMLGLVDDYGGAVEIFGEGLTTDTVNYKRRIGYVPETAELYENLTAQEYLSFVGELYGMDSKDIDHKARKLVKLLGIDDVYKKRISSYSKGMRQKVLLISSLLHDPDLLFLDEPLSGLDANSMMIVKDILAQLAVQGKTIFYSSHIMDVVEKISNRIVLLNGGKIVADGSFEQLKGKNLEGSLEEIFNELTGFDEYKGVAEEFVAVVQGDSAHE